MNRITFLIVLLIAVNLFSQPQRKDKANFIDYQNATWDTIKIEVEQFDKKPEIKKKRFTPDFSNFNIPKSVSEFKPVWHNTPVMQSWTGTCWAFASTSFVESEVYRLQKKSVKLSEMFTVYCEYIAKVRRFVRERGNSLVSEGSQTNSTLRVIKEIGAVPVTAYSGMLDGQKHHSHEKMAREINTYLDFCKKNSFWNENEIIDNIKSILNFYMKEPPTTFQYEGKTYTPESFASDFLKFEPDNYIDVMSLLEGGFWKNAIYDVPDNWSRAEVYFNVPADDFMKAINSAIDNGYSVAIGGDVSEPGLYSYQDAAIIPSFDIPSEFIDDYAKQFRFSNNTTTDDHAIHIVGKTSNSSGDWFLIKDSGSGARNGNLKGYYMFHSDYIKLKMTTFLVHKDAVKFLLDKKK